MLIGADNNLLFCFQQFADSLSVWCRILTLIMLKSSILRRG